MIQDPTVTRASRPAEHLPERGLCAHRGAMQLWPENTLGSFREAILAGAHMIEFDIRLSQDGHPMVIHDQSVARMTDGTGDVRDLTLAQLKQFTVRDPRATARAPERIPTLAETLDIMPRNAWLNLHLKGKVEKPGWRSRLLRPFRRTGARTLLAVKVTRLIAEQQRLHQTFLVCGGSHAIAARRENPKIKICYQVRGSDSRQAVREAIDFGAEFIQLGHKLGPTPELIRLLKRHHVRINYCFGDSRESLRQLFADGIDFPLVNNIHELMPFASEFGLTPLR